MQSYHAAANQQEERALALQDHPGRKCTYFTEKASAGQNNVRIYIVLATFDIISNTLN